VAEADTGGWDECFPTVGACQYPDAAYADVMVPDHGDLWCQAPEMQVDHREHDAEIITRWRGLQLPYTFVRTMHIQHDTVTVSYAVHNHGQAPLHWIWCAHPLIAIAPGMQLHLPPETTFWRMTEAGLREEPATAIAVTPTQRWDMRRMPEHDAGYSVKLYSAQLPAGHVRLQATDGALVWSWSTAEIPQLAVFLNAGGWSNDDGPPHFNLGLEPAIGVYDALSDAYAHTQSYATLDPGQQRRWQLTVQLVADNPQ
jgi:galactose mutarotase-like enzyme